MNETIVQEVLNQQLSGIMLHAGMLDIFISLNLPKLERVQERQLIDEIKTHVKTKREVFGCTEKMVAAKPKITPETVIKKQMTKSETQSLVRQEIRRWRDWEVETITVYANACDKEPDCKLWQHLRKNVEHEIRFIDRLLNHFA